MSGSLKRNLANAYVVEGVSVLGDAFVPEVDNVTDLGTPSKRFKTLYATDISGVTVARNEIATGTANHVVINNGTTGGLSSEATLNPSRGGLGTNASAFTGVVKASGGTFSASEVVGADIATNTIPDSRLQTITSLGKVANSSTSATPSNLPGAIMSRDTSGFTACTGISFGSTMLDNYSEISNTGLAPEILFGGANVGLTYTVRRWRYTRVGRLVFVEWFFIINQKGTSTGVVTITNLPFTTPSVNTGTQLSVSSDLDITTGYIQIVAQPLANTQSVQLFQIADNTGAISLTDTAFANGKSLQAYGFYSV